MTEVGLFGGGDVLLWFSGWLPTHMWLIHHVLRWQLTMTVFPLWSNVKVDERPLLIDGNQVSVDAELFILHTLKEVTQSLQQWCKT